jgi:hypothetical protein
MRRCPPNLVFLLVAAMACVAVPAAADIICDGSASYFVVARPEMYPLFGDSYVLPLTDPEDIALARNIVAGGFAIVVATVTTGDGGYNRDMLAPEGHRWSWHVSEFQEFAAVAAEVCDGNPTMTEGEARNWAPGEETTICYWSFTVVEEIDCTVPTTGTSWGGLKSWYRSARE